MPDTLGKYIVVAFVLAFAFLAWRAWQIKQASPAWPSAVGEVIESRARPFNAQTSEPEAGKNEWLTEVRYRYTVNGVVRTGNRLRAFSPHHFTRAEAEQALQAFPVGARVPVYYDPGQPDVSVLIPG